MSGSRSDGVFSSESTGPDPEEDLQPSVTIRNGVRAYGPFILIGWIGFEILRRKLERAYYVRERSPETATPTTVMARNAGFLGWVWPLYTTSDDVILQSCGMDTLFFLRFLRLCQKVAWLSILLSAALFPIYFYAQRGDKNDALYKMTLSHLDADNDDERWRFWFTVLAMYIVTGFTCFLLWREFIVYVARRHEFLGRKTTQQYTIVVNGLPKNLRTEQTLRNYMEVLFPKSVVSVYVALECGDLEKLVKERVNVRDRLENALAVSAEKGERLKVKTKKMCGTELDAIELYEEQLKSLNDAVEMEVRSIMRNQAALAHQMLEGDGTESDVPTLQVSPDEAAFVDDSRATETDYIKRLRRFTTVLGTNTDNIMRSTGFVTFNKLRAAQSAQQVLQCSDPTEMHVEAASNVEDVVWENVGISLTTKQYWGLISLAATSAIIIFWTIPTAFVVSLSKVDTLKKTLKDHWPALGDFVQKNAWLGPLLEQLSPLMLSVMSALAPIIFGILSKREGHASGAVVDKSLFNKLVIYQWYIVLLLPILGGTFLESLLGKEGSDKLTVSSVVKQVSNRLPVQSSYYITYMMVQMGLPTSLALLRVTPIIKAAIYHYIAPKRTPRQRSSPWFGLAPLSVPGDFGAIDPVAQFFLIFILIVVFSAVAPMLCYFAALYLFIAELLYRWDVLCVSDPSPNTGAEYWPSLYRFCIGALMFAQIIMVTVLGLKKAAAPATFSIILPFLTGLFHLFVWSRYPRTAVNLPIAECVAIDTRRSRQLDDLEKCLDETYHQPAMAERNPIEPDYVLLASDPNDDAPYLEAPPTKEIA